MIEKSRAEVFVKGFAQGLALALTEVFPDISASSASKILTYELFLMEYDRASKKVNLPGPEVLYAAIRAAHQQR